MLRLTIPFALIVVGVSCTSTAFEPIRYAPELRNPDNRALITDPGITFRWQAAPGAERYEVQLDGALLDTTEILRSSVTLTPRREPYCWSVTGVDDLMRYPSVQHCFNLVGPSTSLRSPIDGLAACNADRLSFQWDAVPDATEYVLEVFGEGAQTVGGTPIRTAETTQTLPEVLPEGHYRWTVAAVFDDYVGTHANPYHFVQLGSIQEPEALQLPDDGYTPDEQTLSWTGDADEFEVDLRVGGCQGPSLPGWPKKTTAQSISTGAIDQPGDYGFRVRGIRGQCYSEWVCAESFTLTEGCGRPITTLEWHDVTPPNQVSNLSEIAGEVDPFTRQLIITARDATLQLDLSAPLSPVLTDVSATVGPIANWWHSEGALRFDSIERRMLYFAPASADQTTYELSTEPSLGTWSQVITGPQTPGSLFLEHGAAFDSARNRYLIFGNASSSTVWSLDFNTSPPEWTALTTFGVVPPAMSTIQVGIVGPLDLLITGFGIGGQDRIYVLDLNTMDWSQRFPSGTIPEQRAEYAGDVCGCRFVMAGGAIFSQSATADDQLAVYNVVSNEWENPMITGTPPPLETGNDGAWDPVSRTLYIFGSGDPMLPPTSPQLRKIYALTGL